MSDSKDIAAFADGAPPVRLLFATGQDGEQDVDTTDPTRTSRPVRR